jgi:DNA-binding transcriptional MerR regulator
MRIGQLAQQTGVDTQTIRFYERQGLLPPPEREDNGYRTYKAGHADKLLFIRRCRSFGMSLEEIGVLQSYQEQPQQPCVAVNELLDRHIVRIPRSSGHPFHEHLTTDSTLIRPPIPRASGH